MSVFYTVTTVLILFLQFFNHKFLGQGKLHRVYPISMVVYFLYSVVETMLALSNPAQISILLFNLVNGWAFYNAFVGWRRLKKEKKAATNG